MGCNKLHFLHHNLRINPTLVSLHDVAVPPASFLPLPLKHSVFGGMKTVASVLIEECLDIVAQLQRHLDPAQVP